MTKVIKDLCVSVGKYTTPDGKEKNKYKKVGSIMQADKGNKFILIDKTFNPAGVNNDRDSVLLSVFDVEKQKQPQNATHEQNPQVEESEESIRKKEIWKKLEKHQQKPPQPAFDPNMPNDEIPF